MLSLSAELCASLGEGRHTVTAYTSCGRPQADFLIARPYDDGAQEPQASHVFFWVDIAIFAVFILGYAGVNVYARRKRRVK